MFARDLSLTVGHTLYPASQGPEHLASFKPVLSPYRPEGGIKTVPVCSCYPLGKSDPRRTNRHSLGLLIRMKHHTSQPDKANIFSNHDLCIYHVHKRSHSCYSHQREKRTNKNTIRQLCQKNCPYLRNQQRAKWSSVSLQAQKQEKRCQCVFEFSIAGKTLRPKHDTVHLEEVVLIPIATVGWWSVRVCVYDLMINISNSRYFI